MKKRVTKGGVFLTVYGLIGVIMYAAMHFLSVGNYILEVASETYISSAAAALLVADLMDGQKDILRVCGLLLTCAVVIYVCVSIM